MVDITSTHFAISVLSDGTIVEMTKYGVKFVRNTPVDLQSRLTYFNIN